MRIRTIITTAILSVTVLLLLSACGTQKIDVSQYVEVTFDGLDGSGTAHLRYSELYNAIENIIVGDEDSFSAAIEKYDLADTIADSVNIELDKNSDLSNGDTVTVTISADNRIAKKNGIKFVGTDPIQFTVKDLTEVTEIDPFDSAYFNVTEGNGVYIEFTGVSPKASIQIRNTVPDSNPLSEITYSFGGEYGETVKKGQQVKIKAEAPYEWEDKGYILTSEETTVLCENVDEYITSIDEIDEETMNKIIAQCNDLKTAKLVTSGYNLRYINSEGQSVYAEYIGGYSNARFSKEYFFSLKDGINTSNSYGIFGNDKMSENGLYISFRVNLDNVKNNILSSSEQYNVKDAVGFFSVKDIVKNKDGEIQFTTSMVTMGNALYADEDAFKIDILNPYLDEFTMTEKDSDKKFN